MFFTRALLTLMSMAVVAAGSDQRTAPKSLHLDPPGKKWAARTLRKMTLEEKVTLVHADSKFTTAAIPRLGIPRRWMSDGPHGVREDVGPDDWKPAGHTDDFSTCMPCGIALAATWNPALAQKEGRACKRTPGAGVRGAGRAGARGSGAAGPLRPAGRTGSALARQPRQGQSSAARRGRPGDG